ncbi:kinase-like domain-containing protein [Penicillium lividum]|nr:kinase-like domain-containing protein [Penicillium lividum]
MELLEYGDLQKYLSFNPIPESEAASITAQVAQALQYMHQENFVHRDIKPKNILVSCPGPHWHVKVADFGIAKNTDGTGLETLEVGTHGYMAPELFGNSSDPYTAAVDVWALGAVTFCMRTGSSPFRNLQSLLDYARDYKTQFPIRQLRTSSAFCTSFILPRACVSEEALEKETGKLAVMQDLAMSYRKQQKYDGAEKIGGEVADLRQKMLSAKHLDTMQAMADLAATYHNQEKYDKAEKVWVEVIGLRREVLGDKHPDTITAMEILSMTYYGQKNYSEAKKIRSEILSLRRKTTGSSPNGGQIASVSKNGTVKIWDTVTGQCVSTLMGHSKIVWSIAWLSDSGPSWNITS